MATDSDRLLVNIEASQAKFAKQLAAIAKAAGVTAGGIERDFQRSNDNVAKGFDRTAAAAKKAAAEQAKVMNQSRAVAQNLSFQLNDIAQGLMVGTSPFTLMAQQGGQVVQALSMAPGGAGGAVKALGSAVGSLLNPMSLATFAIIGLGAAAVQYFTSLLSDGEISNKELKEQEQRIQAIVDKWGEALPALKAYANERQRLKEIEGVEEATNAEIARRYDAARKAVADLRLDLDELFAGIVTGAGPEINAVNVAFGNLTLALEENRATSSDVQAVIDGLAAVYEQTLNPAVKSAMDTMTAFAETVRVAAGEAEALSDEAARFQLVEDAFIQLKNAIDSVRSDSARQELQKLFSQAEEGKLSIDAVGTALGNLSGVTPDLSGAIGNLRALFEQAIATQQALNNVMTGGSGPITRGRGRGQRPGDTRSGGVILPGSAPAPSSRPLYEFEALPKAGRGGGGARKSEAEREAEAVAKLIESLEHELSLIGQTAEEQAVMNNLRKLAASATDEQKAKVEELTRTLFQQKEAQQAANRAMEEMRALGKDVLGGFIRDLQAGQSASEALAGALQKVADKLLDIALNSLFDNKGSGILGLLGLGGGPNYGALSASGKYLFDKGGYTGPGGKKQPAGIVHKGEVVWSQDDIARAGGVGVVEAMRTGRLGQAQIAAPSLARTAVSGGGSISAPVTVHIDAKGADREGLMRVEQQVKKLKAEIPAIVVNQVRQMPKKNMK